MTIPQASEYLNCSDENIYTTYKQFIIKGSKRGDAVFDLKAYEKHIQTVENIYNFGIGLYYIIKDDIKIKQNETMFKLLELNRPTITSIINNKWYSFRDRLKVTNTIIDFIHKALKFIGQDIRYIDNNLRWRREYKEHRDIKVYIENNKELE